LNYKIIIIDGGAKLIFQDLTLTSFFGSSTSSRLFELQRRDLGEDWGSGLELLDYDYRQ